MRYVISMVCAAAAAFAAMMFVATPAATWIVDRFTFTNPDDVGDAHAAAFMLVNLAALGLGWGLGWAIGGIVDPDARDTARDTASDRASDRARDKG